MMANIFLDFLHQFDARMGSSDRKMLPCLSTRHSIFDKDHISPCKLHEVTANPLIWV
jgi:hypothetical protein